MKWRQDTLDWDNLRVFLAVARARGVSAAARALEMNVTTVYRRLAALSESLGSELFEPGGTERKLTAQGLALMNRVEEMESAAMTALAEATGRQKGYAGQVRLSVAEGFGTWILAPALPAFQEQHPGIRLDIITASGFLNPSKREADMAVMLARPQRGNLSVQRLGDYRLHLYASPRYLAVHGVPRGRAALHDHVLTGYVPEFLFSPELDYLDEVEAGLEANLRSTSLGIQRQLVLGGAGIGVLPDFIVPPESGLVRVLEDDVEITRSFWLVTHRSLVRLARIRAVSDLLRRQVEAALLPGIIHGRAKASRKA